MVSQRKKMSQSETCIELLEKLEIKKGRRAGLHKNSDNELVRDITKSEDHLKQMKSKLKGKGKGSKSKITEAEIEGAVLIFNPPDYRWQDTKAHELNLPVERLLWHNASPWHIFTVDSPPKHCEQVAGDGNCLFRSLSFWITGSEESHLAIREMLVREFANNQALYLPLTNHPSVESYIRETGMHQEGVWGTEVEIFVAATILNTPIAVFAAFGDRPLWQKFKPLEVPATRERQNRHRQRSSTDSTMMLYLHNSSNHFEPVMDI